MRHDLARFLWLQSHARKASKLMIEAIAMDQRALAAFYARSWAGLVRAAERRLREASR